MVAILSGTWPPDISICVYILELMSMSSDKNRLDGLLQTLSARYRRWTLYTLLNREVGTLDELVTLIRSLNEATGGENIDETKITIQLQQIHLPKLADAGFIEYDSRSGDILLTEKANGVREQIRTIEQWEDPAIRTQLSDVDTFQNNG